MLVDLPNLPGLSRVSADGRRAFAALVERLGWDVDQADALASVIEGESGWQPSIVNGTTRATGLIQFMPATAVQLGTTVEQLGAMTVAEQLEFVERYLRGAAALGGRPVVALTPADVAIATFVPAHIGKPDDFVAFASPSPGYRANAGLDKDRDGRIKLGEVRAYYLRALTPAQGMPRLPLESATTPATPPAAGSAGSTAGASSGRGGVLLVGALLAAFAFRKVVGA